VIGAKKTAKKTGEENGSEENGISPGIGPIFMDEEEGSLDGNL
jgi:hypothetical protein